MSAFVSAPRRGLPVALRFALRELRGARRGFGIFLACLILGVMAIAGVGSFARALTSGLAGEGRAILGGDAAFTLIQREASPTEIAVLDAGGTVSRIASLRAMARTSAGDAALVELKAVDGAYPLAGTLETVPAERLSDLLAVRDGVPGALADETLMARLGVQVGDRLSVGTGSFDIRGLIVTEPDRLSGGITFGPRLMIDLAALDTTGLIQPGSLVRWTYRVRLADPSRAALTGFVDGIKAGAPEAGFEVRTRDSASPQLERNVGRIAQYLTLVGLTALLVGGVGVANAVASHLAAKREVIATLKALGASRRMVFGTFFLQVAMLAAVGIVGGLILGAALPFVASAAIAAMIPFPLAPRVDPYALTLAALYGALVTLAFTLWPLAQAQEAPVSRLFRDALGADIKRPPWRYAALCAVAILALAALALATSVDKRAAFIFLGAAAAAFALLRLVASGIMAVARRLPRPRGTMARLALANIYRPGALTPTVVLSLGLGLTLLVTISLIDRSLTAEFTGALAEKAPSFFFVDVPDSEEATFAAYLKEKAPTGIYRSVPMLRGRITALGDTPAEQAKPSAEAAWVLQSDRGISFSNQVPEGSELVGGTWWGPDERESLVSFEKKLADGLGLGIGDTVTVNVLGRDITARISNLREVNWQRLGINFVMIFSPSTFTGAPHTVLSTLSFPDGADAAHELALLRDVAQRFPTVTTVRVKEALDEANRMLGDLALGIRIASLVTLLASVLVLAGALAAGHQHRVYDAVILKTLGATRARLIGAYALEYAALGLITAVFAIGAGTVAAAYVTVRVMEIGFTFSMPAALGAVLLALAFTVGFGLLGTLRALSEPPVRVLRHL